MAFQGTPLEGIDDDEAEEVFTGALLQASLIDEQRATRIILERIDKRIETVIKALSRRR